MLFPILDYFLHYIGLFSHLYETIFPTLIELFAHLYLTIFLWSCMSAALTRVLSRRLWVTSVTPCFSPPPHASPMRQDT